ncbi:CGNR zinc finger domain-containing protein [Phytoactinopolyspora limicola]|uniref:CGNR zinc finger domain-containing protein n=1 Tax=Phytoactinopolyspora limicola TaxID=2715536 RepID=UPI00140C28ED|nr:CGNR zinc finger domain-containing protein [Phytoactinopolyspora limicola]
MASADEFRFYTGSLATDFVATVGRRGAGGLERLTSPQRLADWLRRADLCREHITATQEDLARARALREAAHRLISARMTGRAAAVSDVAEVNAWALQRPAPPQLATTGTFELASASGIGVDGALAYIAVDLIELLGDSRTALLKACEAADCGMPYIDWSRGRTRRWCSMRECGNRAKVAAHRARKASIQP